jgi:hypothetical protein
MARGQVSLPILIPPSARHLIISHPGLVYTIGQMLTDVPSGLILIPAQEIKICPLLNGNNHQGHEIELATVTEYFQGASTLLVLV